MLVVLVAILLMDLVYFPKRVTVDIFFALKIVGTPTDLVDRRYNSEILMVPTSVLLILSTFPVFLERLFSSTQSVESIKVIQTCLYVGIYLVALVSASGMCLAAFCMQA